MTTLPYTHPELRDTFPPYAVCIGMQQNPCGEPFALYNITGGEYHESTVCVETLEREGIVIRTETEVAT